MEKLIKAGRIFYGIMIIGIGVQQSFYADYRPVILPDWSSHIQGFGYGVYLISAILIACGIAIIFEKKERDVSLILGGIFFVLFCFGHVTWELIIDPINKHLGVWSNALKELALSGGAFAIAGSLPSNKKGKEQELVLIKLFEKFIPFGSIFFSITMILFGIDHFLYADFVATLVPNWIAGHLFWTYFAGVALAGAGIAIMLKIQLKPVAFLLGLMIFLWFICLHIPRAIADPFGDKGNEVTSVFEALGFSGIAFVIAGGYRKRIE
jgi:hypothetical protein